MEEARQIVADIFDRSCELNGNIGWKAAGFFTEENQYVDYICLTRLMQQEQSEVTVLDVGCGQGDLYKFLKERFPKAKYTGIDISQSMLAHAKEKYPDGDFRQADLLDPAFNGRYDYVIAVGGFNVAVPDHEEYFKKVIRKMWRLSRKAAAFNVLSGTWWGDGDRYPELYYYDAPWVFQKCLEVTNHVFLDHFTSEYELHVFLYHR